MMIILILVGVVFFSPFVSWPPDPHFGSFSIWALFRRPGEKIPAEVVLGNMGLSRIFLHYLVEWTRKLLGKNALHIKVRWVQAGFLILTGIVLYSISVKYLLINPTIAMIGTIIFFYVSSRPQFLFAYLNAEIFYFFFASLAVMVLFWGGFNLELNFPAGIFFTALFVFAGLHAKPCYLIDPFLIGITSLALLGWSWSYMSAMLIGGLVGAGFYFFMLRGHMYADSLKWLLLYRKQFSSTFSNIFSLFLVKYKKDLSSSPLLGLMVLTLAGIIFGPWDNYQFILCAWMIASLLSLFVQGRFERYHFFPLFPPASILATRGISTFAQENEGLMMMVLLLFLFLGRRSLKDFFFFYGSASMEEKMARGVPNYVYYWDTRMELVTNHNTRKQADFIAWGIIPQMYYLVNQRPVTSYTFFHHWMAFLYEPWKKIMLKDVIKTTPEWIYDFNAWNKRYGHFNSLGFFAATGLVYAPVDRKKNLVFYQLIPPTTVLPSLSDMGWPSARFNIYVKKSPMADLFQDEMEIIGYSRNSLPQEWRKDILSIVSSLVCGERMTFPELHEEEETLWENHNTGYLIKLYGAAISMHRNDKNKGICLLAEWLDIWKASIQFFPQINALVFVLERLAGTKEPTISLDKNCLNLLPPEQTLELAQFLLLSLNAGVLADTEKIYIKKMLGNIRIDSGSYFDEKIKIGLHEIKKNQILTV